MSVRILTGDCRDVLAKLPADSVHCVVTSPPYWGLRDYQIPPSVWGGDPACEHLWGDDVTKIGGGKQPADKVRWQHDTEARPNGHQVAAAGAFCQHCNAWAGAHGLEPTIDLYVKNAVQIFRAMHRVLRPDGTLWLNLGDSYAAGKTGRDDNSGANLARRAATYGTGTGEGRGPTTGKSRGPTDGLKPKDLCGIPWRVAFALQADGWWLRQDIIWEKPNPMPESVTDRCTKAHEYLFLLTKSARYFYDAEAIKEDVTGNAHARGNGVNPKCAEPGNGIKQNSSFSGAVNELVSNRNKRSVWTVATAPFSEAHFATFSPALIEPCIKAGTSEKGCCAKCGAPWERVVERSSIKPVDYDGKNAATDPQSSHRRMLANVRARRLAGEPHDNPFPPAQTLGWHPTCKCDAPVVPATVLDPFFGAGTTGLVADRLQRNCIGIELNPDYASMAHRRLSADAPLLAQVEAAE